MSFGKRLEMVTRAPAATLAPKGFDQGYVCQLNDKEAAARAAVLKANLLRLTNRK